MRGKLSHLAQRLLHTWTDSLGTFFKTFAIMISSKSDSNIIWRSSKKITFPKIWRVWLKNWVCHALGKFKIEMGVADSIFKPHPSNFGKSDIFWRSSNDITITFGKNHYCKSFKKCTQAIRPGVEESLARFSLMLCKWNSENLVWPMNYLFIA